MLMPVLRGCERRRIGHGRAAGETLANVDGRLAVDQAFAREQRDAVGRSDCDDGLRLPGGKSRPRDVGPDTADDRELAWRAEVKLQGAKRPAERRRRPLERRPDEPEDAHRAAFELVVAVDAR